MQVDSPQFSDDLPPASLVLGVLGSLGELRLRRRYCRCQVGRNSGDTFEGTGFKACESAQAPTAREEFQGRSPACAVRGHLKKRRELAP